MWVQVERIRFDLRWSRPVNTGRGLPAGIAERKGSGWGFTYKRREVQREARRWSLFHLLVWFIVHDLNRGWNFNWHGSEFCQIWMMKYSVQTINHLFLWMQVVLVFFWGEATLGLHGFYPSELYCTIDYQPACKLRVMLSLQQVMRSFGNLKTTVYNSRLPHRAAKHFLVFSYSLERVPLLVFRQMYDVSNGCIDLCFCICFLPMHMRKTIYDIGCRLFCSMDVQIKSQYLSNRVCL